MQYTVNLRVYFTRGTVAFLFSSTTNSLVLFGLALLQSVSLLLLSYHLFVHLSPNATDYRRIGLVAMLIGGFMCLLFTGYIFLETYLRVTSPAQLRPNKAMLAALPVAAGNGLLLLLLVRAQVGRIRWGGWQIPLQSLFSITVLAFVVTAFIHYTGFAFMDTLLGLLMGISLFVAAAFCVLDAYWKIGELA